MASALICPLGYMPVSALAHVPPESVLFHTPAENVPA
jgi:hypothetical protein